MLVDVNHKSSTSGHTLVKSAAHKKKFYPMTANIAHRFPMMPYFPSATEIGKAAPQLVRAPCLNAGIYYLIP